MSLRRALAAGLAAALLPLTAVLAADDPAAPGEGGPQDAVVVAVIDSGFSPYHHDYLASEMPQAYDADPGNDLPLDAPPHEWLPGFPDPSTFAAYSPLQIDVDAVADPTAKPAALAAADDAAWSTVQRSTSDAVHYRWLPGTKVVGALTFGSGRVLDGTGAHGMGTASSAVGNLYGTCPSCALLFIQYGDRAQAEDAIEWAMAQPWIDVITNSYGFSLVNRDRFYAGSDTEAQRAAVERGQQVFFSAGNGQENAFLVPNTTLFSSQEGPDWIVTVTAGHPRNSGSYTGTGKPADVAGLGTDYPTSYGATTTTNGGNFGGTSNATPQVAGQYAEALYRIRTALPGASRVQTGGVIATGPAGCAAARPDCELADGVLTGRELRDRLLQSAVSTGKGFDVGSQGLGQPSPRVLDTYRAAEGHGTYFGRWAKDRVDRYEPEMQRLVGPVLGTSAPPERPAGEREYFVADSACRQHLWGGWSGGYWDGKAPLPAADPQQPTRTFLAGPCRSLPQLLSRENPTS
ncbi:MAG TPA: S8/S53 family peptidase [Mycobacteriales bacterium]|nr:S8/S53 family peptidase [Mycobacteriales bacterium]